MASAFPLWVERLFIFFDEWIWIFLSLYLGNRWRQAKIEYLQKRWQWGESQFCEHCKHVLEPLARPMCLVQFNERYWRWVFFTVLGAGIVFNYIIGYLVFFRHAGIL